MMNIQTLYEGYKGVVKHSLKELANKFLVCKKCGSRVSVSFSMSETNGKVDRAGYEFKCSNLACGEYMKNSEIEDIMPMDFGSSKTKYMYMDQVERIEKLMKIKKYISDYRFMKKRKGNRIHQCELCSKDVVQGETYLYQSNSYTSVRGRHYSISEYICIECVSRYLKEVEIKKSEEKKVSNEKNEKYFCIRCGRYHSRGKIFDDDKVYDARNFYQQGNFKNVEEYISTILNK